MALGTYVPVNEDSGRRLLPAARTRQERRFPTAIPHHKVLSYSWETAEPARQIFESLQRLAHDAAYLGRARAFTRFWFHRDFNTLKDRPPLASRTWVYPGRLAELETAYRYGKLAGPGASVPTQRPSESSYPGSEFGADWIVYSDAGGRRPDLRRTASAARALRAQVLRGFGDRRVPEMFSGHEGRTGRPTRKPHMAIFPLGNVGWRYSDDRLMGLAICLPRDRTPEDQEALASALLRMHALCRVADGDASEIEVPLAEGAEPWLLVRQPEPVASSLKPYRYLKPAHTWTTVTPVVLDKSPLSRNYEGRQRQLGDQLRLACEFTGLPQPVTVVTERNSLIPGAPRATFTPHNARRRRRPGARAELADWDSWDLPPHFAGRTVTHATLTWREPVQGPIALADGRFIGLGLCLPLD